MCKIDHVVSIIQLFEVSFCSLFLNTMGFLAFSQYVLFFPAFITTTFIKKKKPNAFLLIVAVGKTVATWQIKEEASLHK